MSNYYNLELLLMDKSGRTGITTIDSLAHGLLYTDQLWKEREIDVHENHATINDEVRHLQVSIYNWDTSDVLNDLIESAFRIHIISDKFAEIERFRTEIIVHLKKRLEFSNIRLLTDDVSTHLSREIYPKINRVENNLRHYLVKFFIQKIGLDWWMVTAPKHLDEKIRFRKKYDNAFSKLIDQDVSLIDFNDLGDLIYKQSTGFNNEQAIIDRIKEVNTVSELKELQEDLAGNYNKYFKESFQDNLFEKKWKALIEVRNKVAHNSLLTLEDLNMASQLSEDLMKIISSAEEKIDDFKLNEKEKEIIRKASWEAAQEAEESDTSLTDLGIKVVGKIDLDNLDNSKSQSDSQQQVITEEEMIDELRLTEENLEEADFRYVGLKAFITKILAQKGYAISPSYALINILDNKGVVDIYDYDDEYNYYPVKAVRLSEEYEAETV